MVTCQTHSFSFAHVEIEEILMNALSEFFVLSRPYAQFVDPMEPDSRTSRITLSAWLASIRYQLTQVHLPENTEEAGVCFIKFRTQITDSETNQRRES